MIELDAEDMGSMLLRAFTKGHGKSTIYCDDPDTIGGNSHALPRFTTSPHRSCF